MSKSSPHEIIEKAATDIVSASLQGKQNAHTFIACLSQLQKDLWQGNKINVLFNMEEAELQASYGDMLHIVDYANLVSQIKGPAKWAFVTVDETHESFVDRFIMLKDENNIEVRRFRAEQEAAQWLGAQPRHQVAKLELRTAKPMSPFKLPDR